MVRMGEVKLLCLANNFYTLALQEFEGSKGIP